MDEKNNNCIVLSLLSYLQKQMPDVIKATLCLDLLIVCMCSNLCEELKRTTGTFKVDAELSNCRMLRKAILFAFQRSEVRVGYRKTSLELGGN